MRERLVALCFAAAASALSACQGGGGTMAAVGNEPSGAPPSDSTPGTNQGEFSMPIRPIIEG
jgi:hypothetical protein